MSTNKQRILITGGAGFIGANFIYKFLELGYDVSIFERKEANLWRIKKIKNKIKLYSPNLTSYNETEKIISKINPDIVIHFATYGAYQRFQQDTKNTIDTNIISSINLINACNKIGVKCFINTGSSSEYGIKSKPMKETDVLEPDNLYGITKSAITQYGQMIAIKFNFPIVTIRPFAVYGYFEEEGRLITTIIKSCLKNTEPNLSNPKSVRDFIFIEDLIDGYLAVIKNIKKIKAEIFNLGSGRQSSIDNVFKTVKKITGSSIKPNYGKMRNTQTEPKIWLANILKAKKLLDWKPKYNLEQGIKKNVEWFKKNMDLYE
jgi:nucleoside-diphosphate-sugar epimerase